MKLNTKTLYAMIALEVPEYTSIRDIEENSEFTLKHDRIISVDWFDTFAIKAKGDHV